MKNVLHKTFVDNIIIHKDSKKEISIFTTKNSNPLYNVGYQGRSVIEQEPQSFTTQARIYYQERQKIALPDKQNSNDAVLSIPLSEGEVKIVLDEDAYVFLDGAKRIELDGKLYYLKSDPSKTGLLGRTFYVLFLTIKE